MSRRPIGTDGWVEIRADGALYRIARNNQQVPRRNQHNVPADVGLCALIDGRNAGTPGEIVTRNGRTMLIRGVDRPSSSMRSRSGEFVDPAEIRTATFQADRSTGTSTSTTGWTLTGYGAVFNDWTTIWDRSGEFRERIAPGAFSQSLKARTPVIQYDHGKHPMIGTIPLGRFDDIREDSKGLFVRAALTDNWLIQPVRDAIRDGGVTGMSFRFIVLADKWEFIEKVEHRTILNVDLYEVGPVSTPAYPTTSVGVS